jgi:multisubunit Na+/H+ antiporter MnhE subunit
MKQKYPIKEIISELILILASVLVFRSTWMMLDKYLHTSYVLAQLILGVIISILVLYQLNKPKK